MIKRWIVALRRGALSAGKTVVLAETRKDAVEKAEAKHAGCVAVSARPDKPKEG